MIKPTPIASYAAVMYAALLHVIEAAILLATTSADGSIGMDALLWVIPHRFILVGMLLAASGAASSVILVGRRLPVGLVILLLAPQQWFLLVTGLSAWLAVWHGSYADGVLRPHAFITADQLPRGMFSLIHLTAIYGIAIFQRHRTIPRISPGEFQGEMRSAISRVTEILNDVRIQLGRRLPRG